MAFGVWVYVNQRALYRQLADFLPKGKYTVDIYNDDPTLNTRTKVSSKNITIKSGKPITLLLQASGGAALKFTPKE